MKFLVHDLGIFLEQANALAEGGKNEVIYCTPWASAYPKFADFCIGLDFEHVRKADKHGNPLLFWDWVEWADCVVSFDVHQNDELAYIRNKYPNKSTWGSGLGERLEADRIALKQWIKAIGLPMQKYAVVEGLTKLREYIKTNPDKFVKMNIFRGDMESFHAKDAEFNDLQFDKMAVAYGPKKESIKFMVEDMIDTDVEIGYDGFFNGMNYADKCFVGYEFHKNAYLAKVTDFEDLPDQIYETMDAFTPVLQKLDFRGALSTEEKIVSKTEHYFLDICSRLPSPLSQLYPVMIKNWAEVVYKFGLKQDVELDIENRYVGAIALESEYAKDNFLRIDVDKKNRDKIRFQSACMNAGKYYAVKGNSNVCVLVAGGDSVDDVLSKLKDYAKLVDGHGIDKDDVNGMDVMKEIIEKGKQVGIDF